VQEHPEPAASAAPEGGRHSDRVERRLQALRDAHDRAAGGTGSDVSAPAGDNVQVRKGVNEGSDPAAALRPKPRPGMGGSLPPARANPAAADGSILSDDEDPDDIPGLRRMALEDSDPERRLAAVTLLGASDDPEAIPILAQTLQDQDEEVRLAAIQSLADVTGEVPVDVIGGAALNDPSADNRYEALEVLSDIGTEAARAYIAKAANDPDEDVQDFAKSNLETDETNEGDQPEPAEEPNPTPHN
jgi:hypothetical protein